MSQQTINVGVAANDGTGDTLRTAFQKANANFAELYGGLPAGGNRNEVLAKAGAGDLDDAWASPLLLHPGYKTGGGRYYSPFPRIGTPSATITAAANTIYYTPMFVPKRTTFDRVGLKTGSSNAVAANALLAIYANLASGEPGGKLLTVNASAVAIPGTANTNVSLTPDGGAFTLDAGFHWAAVVLDAGAQMCGAAAEVLHGYWFGTANTAAWYAATSQVAGFTEAGASLPAAATPTAASSSIPSPILRVQ